MDFTLTEDQQLLRETARRLLDKECPPSLVRAHIEDPSEYEPLWVHLREYTALGAGPATDLCLFLEETGAACAPGPFLATALYTSLIGDDGSSAATGTVAFVDDPVNPFVLEADRVDVIAVVLPGPAIAVVPTARCRRAAFRPAGRLLAPAVHARHHRSHARPAADRPGAAGSVARPRVRVARGRDGRHRPAHLRR